MFSTFWARLKMLFSDEFWKDLTVMENRISALNIRVESCKEMIKDLNSINVDVSPIGRDPNVIIAVGRYRNMDYVQVHSFHQESFAEIIHHIIALRREGRVDRIDAPRNMRFAIKDEMRQRGWE